LHIPAATHPSSKVNDQILDFYVKKIVPAITTGVAKTEDDGNYGSAATRDVEVLQALSRRIHFGMSFLLRPYSAAREALIAAYLGDVFCTYSYNRHVCV
jgi:hypothetical protein